MMRVVANLGLRMLALIVCCALPAGAAPQICDAAARDAARATGVPVALLLTLTRVETGRTSPHTAPEPWPWTLNTGGRGSYHDTAQAALSAARRAISEGRRSIDIGCFQINYRWHGDRFPSLEVMLDPSQNALYAARFLRTLYAEFGDWTAAAGAFHSRNPEKSAAYLARVQKIRSHMAPHVAPHRGPMAGGVGAAMGPGPLPMAPRPALTVGLARPMRDDARPLLAAPLRPMWETR